MWWSPVAATGPCDPPSAGVVPDRWTRPSISDRTRPEVVLLCGTQASVTPPCRAAPVVAPPRQVTDLSNDVWRVLREQAAKRAGISKGSRDTPRPDQSAPP